MFANISIDVENVPSNKNIDKNPLFATTNLLLFGVLIIHFKFESDFWLLMYRSSY